MYWIRRADNLGSSRSATKRWEQCRQKTGNVGSSKTDGLMQYNNTKSPEPDYWDSQSQGVGQQESSPREVVDSSDAFG